MALREEGREVTLRKKISVDTRGLTVNLRAKIKREELE